MSATPSPGLLFYGHLQAAEGGLEGVGEVRGAPETEIVRALGSEEAE